MITTGKKDYLSAECESMIGDERDEITHFLKRKDNGLIIREIHIKGNTPGATVDICQVSDIHFNTLNERDFNECDPCLLKKSIQDFPLFGTVIFFIYQEYRRKSSCYCDEQ